MKTIQIHARLLQKIRVLPAAERRLIGKAISEAQRSTGQPHLHKGIGLRKLQDNYFEIRVGLDQRLIFENTPESLVFEFLGNHDQVRRFLRNL